MYNMATIRQTKARLKDDGIPVSEGALRRWVKDGAIPSVKAGNRNLLYYPSVLEYLTGTGQVTASATSEREATNTDPQKIDSDWLYDDDKFDTLEDLLIE